MSVDTNLLQKNFAKDLSNLYALVAWASEQQIVGSYGDRRPDLGRMFTCPSCRTRRRQGDPKCCNSAYAKTRRARVDENGLQQVECKEQVNANFFPKNFMKRFIHKKHGQNRRFQISQLFRRFQADSKLLEEAVAEMQERWPLLKAPDLAAIPAFTERYWIWKQAQIVGKQKAQQKLSRRINRVN